jgi:RHS repeat-associated protein
MSNNDNHTIFYAYKGTIQPAMRVELRYYSGNYQVRAQARKDSLYVNTSYYTISDDEHYIEVAWSAATSPGANNGELTLYVDGVQKESITNIDHDTIYIDRVQFGAVTEVDTGTRGTYYFDAFESRSSGYIGPVAAIPGMQVAMVKPADSFLASLSYWLLNLLQEIFEWVVTFFQPGSALASEVQVEAVSVMSVVMLEESIPTGQVWKTYYYAGSQRVAMRVNDGETDEVFYLFTDHLGSTSITTDSEGNLYGEMRYTAWGEVRYSSGQTPTDYTYTGQRSEVEGFGLMYYNARWYDSALGRFAEGDSIVPWVGNVLAWDRFAYVYNNPLNLVDPSGFDPIYIEGWDDDYLQQQEGNTCAVVSVAVSLSILYGHKITQQDVQPAFFWTYRIEERHSMEWDDGLSTYTINLTIYPGIGVIPQIQAYAVDKFDPGLEASYTCLLYTSPSPRDRQKSRMPSSA